MLKKETIIPLSLTLVLVLGLVAYNFFNPSSTKPNPSEPAKPKVVVYKSPSCGCCANYLTYLKRWGFEVEARNLLEQELSQLKKQYQVPEELEACHTAVIDNYVVEGHVPIEAINKLLAERPNILGIGLPGMPEGAPGMAGGRKSGFEIYQINRTGEPVTLFMKI